MEKLIQQDARASVDARSTRELLGALAANWRAQASNARLQAREATRRAIALERRAQALEAGLRGQQELPLTSAGERHRLTVR